MRGKEKEGGALGKPESRKGKLRAEDRERSPVEQREEEQGAKAERRNLTTT